MAEQPAGSYPVVLGRPLGGPSITVGSADDAEESRADAVASRVVAALRERGAAPAPDRTPAVGSGSVSALRRRAAPSAAAGRAGGTLSGELADELSQASRSGGRPLAAATRGSFEQAMGADLSGVRIHTGGQATELNRQVGAQAFTLGRDIFFAGGMPDLRTPAGQHLLAHELAHAVSAEAGGVRRAVVAQLQVAPDKVDASTLIITGVSIVGRPPPTFSSSMGDHSTAFTVHVNAIQLALEGVPLNQAAARLQDLAQGLLRSPGAALIGNLPPRQAGMWREAYQRLVNANGQLVKGADPAAVQEYIAAYLELRELVPLSTVNTGSVSKATSGKGKGEDCGALRAQAAGVKQDPAILYGEIVGLLDVRAVALACVEPDQERLNDLAPGLPANLDSQHRAQLFVEQHLRTIQTAFPGALAGLAEATGHLAPDTSIGSTQDPRVAARARDELALPLVGTELLHRIVIPRARQSLIDELPVQLNALTKLRDEIIETRPEPDSSDPTTSDATTSDVTTSDATTSDPTTSDATTSDATMDAPSKKRGRGADSKKSREVLGRLLALEAAQLVRVNALEKLLGRPITPALDAASPDVMSSRRVVSVPRSSGGLRTSGRQRTPTASKDYAVISNHELSVRHEAAVQATMKKNDAPVKKKTAEEIEEENERVGSLAVQVVVDDRGIITDLRSAGRPPSPFSGTMGAHTTAWTVHVDRVRSLIVKKTVAQALAEVRKTLADERKQTTERFTAQFQFPAEHKDIPYTAQPDSSSDLLNLQNAVIGHLEEINAIPGATLPAADIGGKSEGKHRRILLEHFGLLQYEGKQKTHTQDELLQAIVGLVDVSSLLNEEQGTGELAELQVLSDQAVPVVVQEHLREIEQAYPGALAAAGLSLDTLKVSARKVLTAAKKAADKGKSDGSDTKRRKKVHDSGEVDETASCEGTVDLSGSTDATMSVGADDDKGASSGGKSTDSSQAMEWDESIFGKAPSDWLFDHELEFTGSLLGGIGATAISNQQQNQQPQWLDNRGNLLDAHLADFRAAYLADLALPGVYLAEGEGSAVADAFGINVDVYRDNIPPGYTAIPNLGNGDCLIHAASDVRAAHALQQQGRALADIPGLLGPPGPRAVPGGEVARIRGVVVANANEVNTSMAVRDIVQNEVGGRGTAGLGPRLRGLLRNLDLQYEAAVERGRRQREKAEKEVAEQQRLRELRHKQQGLNRRKKNKVKSSLPVSSPPVSSPPVSLPAVGPPPVVLPVLPQVSYGTTGAPLADFALLHTGGNHYVALVRTG